MQTWLSNLRRKAKEFMRRIGPGRDAYMRSLMPKDELGMMRWMLVDHQHGLLTWPPAPCSWLCKRKLERFHFSCLTCWTRRLHFKKWGWKNLRKRNMLYMANKPPVGNRGFIPVQRLSFSANGSVVVPVYYTNYGIFVPCDKQGAVNRVRLFLIKYLLTLAERIAEF